MVLDCTLVDIDSMFYTSVQGTYFYQVIFGTKFKFSGKKGPIGSTIHTERHQFYWDQGIMAQTVKVSFYNKVLLILVLNTSNL